MLRYTKKVIPCTFACQLESCCDGRKSEQFIVVDEHCHTDGSLTDAAAVTEPHHGGVSCHRSTALATLWREEASRSGTDEPQEVTSAPGIEPARRGYIAHRVTIFVFLQSFGQGGLSVGGIHLQATGKPR